MSSLSIPASTSTGLKQTFRGLHLRTHPDSDVRKSKVMLVHADEIVFNDGYPEASGLDRLIADITASGAGGLDTGSEGASRWYEIYTIRKSSDGTKNLLLHRAKDYLLDQSQTTDDGDTGIRNASGNTKRAQTFLCGTTGPCPYVDVKLTKQASPTGNLWVSIYATSAGAPTGAAIVSSDKIDVSLIASAQIIRFIFRNPTTLSSGTTYALVYEGDFTIDGTNYVSLRAITAGAYANGSGFTYNGSVWASETRDYWFKIYITENDTAVTMPSGYDQKCLIGYVYNDSGSDFKPFVQYDRRVAINRLNLVTGVTTITLVDASSFIPPRPVSFVGEMSSTVAGDIFYITGVPDGYGGNGSNIGQQQVAHATAPDGSFSPVYVDYQGVYFQQAAGTGTGTLLIRGYMW